MGLLFLLFAGLMLFITLAAVTSNANRNYCRENKIENSFDDTSLFVAVVLFTTISIVLAIAFTVVAIINTVLTVQTWYAS